MAIEKFRDVTINGRDYRVGLVTALVGDWISRNLRRGMTMGEDTYAKIQGYLLSTCSIYQEAQATGARVPMKLYDNGRWLNPSLDLEYDLDTVNRLCEECLSFNFDDFFKKKIAEESARAQAEAAKAAQSSVTTQ